MIVRLMRRGCASRRRRAARRRFFSRPGGTRTWLASCEKKCGRFGAYFARWRALWLRARCRFVLFTPRLIQRYRGLQGSGAALDP